MATPKPRAFWPLTITAGVNDKINLRLSSTLYTATIAAGTYYEPTKFARAVRDALTAAIENAWSVEVVGTNLAGFNPSFEAGFGTNGWSQYNNSAGLEPFTSWGAGAYWSDDRKYQTLAHGNQFLGMSWSVNNTTTKGFVTGASNSCGDGTFGGLAWRLNEWYRVRLKALAFGTNIGQPLALAFNAAPTTKTAILVPTLTATLQQYEWRLQWTSGLPKTGATGETGEMYVTIEGGSGTQGTLRFDDIDVRSERTDYGHVVIGGSTAFELLFSSGTNAATSARDVLGFGTLDTSAATSHVSTFQHQNGWYADRAVRFDSKERFDRVIAGEVSHAGRVRSVQFGGVRELRAVEFAMLPAYKTKIAREGPTNANEAIERLWRDGKGRFRWWPDTAVEPDYVDYALDPGALEAFNPVRERVGAERYGLGWTFRRYV